LNREPASLIFDEVDSGIGGAVADKVGERLARLAKRNETHQKADGQKRFHPGQKLNPHARYVTRPLGQDQRLGELMTGGMGMEAGLM
jgi:DNA repair ATPase RecN